MLAGWQAGGLPGWECPDQLDDPGLVPYYDYHGRAEKTVSGR